MNKLLNDDQLLLVKETEAYKDKKYKKQVKELLDMGTFGNIDIEVLKIKRKVYNKKFWLEYMYLIIKEKFGIK